MLFRDRIDAGRQLATALAEFEDHNDAVVLALPRGGVPVGFALAQELRLPLDVFLVRKLGVPGQEELAMGAVASLPQPAKTGQSGDPGSPPQPAKTGQSGGPGSSGVRVLNSEVVRELGITSEQIERVAAAEEQELERRARVFREGHPLMDVSDKIAILVDDGLATGSTMRAAVKALRQAQPAQIVVAVPVGAGVTCDLLRSEADRVVCLVTPEHFFAVGQWYSEFSQTTDDEVRELLRRAREGMQDSKCKTQNSGLAIEIPVAGGKIDGDLIVPQNARGIVVFAHGSGSSRHSPRNQFVAEQLQQAGLGTLLMDLLTPAEESVDVYAGEHRFDIAMLAGRVVLATDWLRDQPNYSGLPVGYFGASTGAAAALVAATERSNVAAVVSRGGRPDLAGDRLRLVKAPTLLIVGGDDAEVIQLNREAYDQMSCEKRLEIVPGASHLFEEPGTLEQVAELAREWFVRWMGGAGVKAA